MPIMCQTVLYSEGIRINKTYVLAYRSMGEDN